MQYSPRGETRVNWTMYILSYSFAKIDEVLMYARVPLFCRTNMSPPLAMTSPPILSLESDRSTGPFDTLYLMMVCPVMTSRMTTFPPNSPKAFVQSSDTKDDTFKSKKLRGVFAMSLLPGDAIVVVWQRGVSRHPVFKSLSNKPVIHSVVPL